MAISVLMATEQFAAEEAFARLHSASKRLHRDLRDVARHVTTTGHLPDEPGNPPPQVPER